MRLEKVSSDVPCAVAAGEMFDRVDMYGPFADFDAASEWADEHIGSSRSWWVVILNDPRSGDQGSGTVWVEERP